MNPIPSPLPAPSGATLPPGRPSPAGGDADFAGIVTVGNRDCTEVRPENVNALPGETHGCQSRQEGTRAAGSRPSQAKIVAMALPGSLSSWRWVTVRRRSAGAVEVTALVNRPQASSGVRSLSLW